MLLEQQILDTLGSIQISVKVSPFYTKTTYYYPSPPPSPNPPKRTLSAPAEFKVLSDSTPDSPTKMPTAVRQARFAPIPATYSRLPHDDETYVMKAYSRHISHCDTCMPPSHLCLKGQARALDVTEYIINSSGHAYSVVDLEDNRRMEVEIPANCEPVRGLLKAVERGALRLSSKSSGKEKSGRGQSYDETYYVPPRRLPSTYGQRDLAQDLELRRPSYTTHDKPSRYATKPRLETVEPPSKPLSRSTSKRRAYDVIERRPTYYSVGSRGKLPVPAKDDWY